MEWYQIVDKARSLIDEIDAKLNREQKQTQEPESKPCHWCGAVGDEEHGCGVPEKEPECICQFEDYDTKCPKHGEKPAKKECEHNWSEWLLCKDGLYRECSECYKEELKPNKDELAERLEKKADGMPNFHGYCSDRVLWNFLADEARKWAVEIVKEWFPSSYLKETYAQELVARLKESK